MTDAVDLGTYDIKDCTALDEKGVTRVCDPRSWVLWLYAVWHGLPFRSSPYGTEMWRPYSSGEPDTPYLYFVVKHHPLGVVE